METFGSSLSLSQAMGVMPAHTKQDTDPQPVDPAPPRNKTMFQGFEWYVPADSKHWDRLREVSPALSAIGITSLWIPPACKGLYSKNVGYDIYDLYDLGEFDQKGSVSTKYGTKEELQSLVNAAENLGMDVIFDVVINHKAGGDFCEPVRAVRVDPHDRLRVISEGPEDIVVWTGFNYPFRAGKYSTFNWNKEHFSAADYDEKTKNTAIWKFEGKDWAADADKEKGNHDYLMFANIDFANEEARKEVCRWIEWLPTQIKLGGLRLDAIKHISKEFVKYFVEHIRATVGPDWLIVGEYSHWNSRFMAEIIEFFDHQMYLYDIPLLYNFRDCSEAAIHETDLRKIMDNSLVVAKPEQALTYVISHDHQEGQTNETVVHAWFVPLAYSIILLHARGGYPCIFYGDVYGLYGPKDDREEGILELPEFRFQIPKLVMARKYFAYGTQSEYFDEPHCIGWTRHGHAAHGGGGGIAVLLTCSQHLASKWMCVGEKHKGERWTDILGNASGREVIINVHGWAEFSVEARAVSVWACASGATRGIIDDFDFDFNIYKV